MAYAPLGRGFLTATIKTLDTLLPKDRRRDHPRFIPENIGRNAELLAPIEKIAAANKCTAAQVALAWVLAQGEDIVPIPGTKRRKYLEQNCAALDIRLRRRGNGIALGGFSARRHRGDPLSRSADEGSRHLMP